MKSRTIKFKSGESKPIPEVQELYVLIPGDLPIFSEALLVAAALSYLLLE